MALATEKLYYRRAGVTYSINLYTATSDVGTEYLSVRVAGNIRYAGIVATTDGRASHLRVQKGGTTKAIASTAIDYIGVWTTFGNSPPYSQPGWNQYTISTDYNKVFSSSSLFNFRVNFTITGASGYTIACRVTIDGNISIWNYSTGLRTNNFRLSTGSHTIRLWSGYEDVSDTRSMQYSSQGQTVV